jgi:hypothetical protein
MYKNSTNQKRNYSRNGEEGIKESSGRGEFKYDIFDTL